LRRPPIGVFAGTSLNTYLLNNVAVAIDVDPTAPDAYQAFIANDKDFAATRIAYRLGLRGPAVTVQNACSTGLVAVLQACRALAAGDCSMALAAAASVYVPHETGYVFHEGMIASPDGHCRAFDAAAHGTTFGNGVAAVALRPLSAALAAGDRVLAVIRGGAINNDGAAKAGFTAPSVEGQAAAITAALARADVPAASIGYIETHGTGTPLGDAVEIAALNQAYVPAGLTATASCPIGSVKTNVGHMDIAAGMGGLIKTVLALRHAEVPPSLHFTAPHPDLPFSAGPFFQLSRRTGSDNFAVIDHGDPRCRPVRFIHVVCSQENSDTFGPVEIPDVRPQLVAALRIETQCRFIEKQDPGRMEQAAGDFEPPLHATREPLHAIVSAIPQLE